VDRFHGACQLGQFEYMKLTSQHTLDGTWFRWPTTCAATKVKKSQNNITKETHIRHGSELLLTSLHEE